MRQPTVYSQCTWLSNSIASWIYAVGDDRNGVFETNETNNVCSASLNIPGGKVITAATMRDQLHMIHPFWRHK